MNKKDSKNDKKDVGKKGSPTPSAKTGTPTQGIKPQPVPATKNTPTPANNPPQKVNTPNVTPATNTPGNQTTTPK